MSVDRCGIRRRAPTDGLNFEDPLPAIEIETEDEESAEALQ